MPSQNKDQSARGADRKNKSEKVEKENEWIKYQIKNIQLSRNDDKQLGSFNLTLTIFYEDEVLNAIVLILKQTRQQK